MNDLPRAQPVGPLPRMDEQARLTYARRLRPARVAQGRTQEDVAREAGISRNTLASMESGKRAPQLEKLWAVMLELDIEPERSEPEWLQEWWRIVEPLALRLPVERRGETFGKVIELLHDALRQDEGGPR